MFDQCVNTQSLVCVDVGVNVYKLDAKAHGFTCPIAGSSIHGSSLDEAIERRVVGMILYAVTQSIQLPPEFICLVAQKVKPKALLTRIARTTVRHNEFVAIPAVTMCRDIWSQQKSAPVVPTVSSPTRGMALERMVNGIKITDDMEVSEPVRKVLSSDNGSRTQQKQILKTLEIEKWRRHVADTGSPECQIAALTVRIDSLYDHVHSSARKDYSCKRGLVKLMARRRKMLSYLKRKDFEIYRRVALETGLR